MVNRHTKQRSSSLAPEGLFNITTSKAMDINLLK